MRTDCTRDRQKTLCRNASTIGEGTIWAVPGSWVQYAESVETGETAAGAARLLSAVVAADRDLQKRTGDGFEWLHGPDFEAARQLIEAAPVRRLDCGRVVGRVHCEGRTWLEVIALLGAADCPAVRWIDPDSVTVCKPFPPYLEFAFMCGPWDSAESILARVAYGFPCESVIRGRHS